MDINTRDYGRGDVRPPFLITVRSRLRAWEGTLLNGQPRPAAYVVMTNMPWEYDLDGPVRRSTYLAEGFQIPDFKDGMLVGLLNASNVTARITEWVSDTAACRLSQRNAAAVGASAVPCLTRITEVPIC
jgi:hypothetical protein